MKLNSHLSRCRALVVPVLVSFLLNQVVPFSLTPNAFAATQAIPGSEESAATKPPPTTAPAPTSYQSYTSSTIPDGALSPPSLPSTDDYHSAYYSGMPSTSTTATDYKPFNYASETADSAYDYYSLTTPYDYDQYGNSYSTSDSNPTPYDDSYSTPTTTSTYSDPQNSTSSQTAYSSISSDSYPYLAEETVFPGNYELSAEFSSASVSTADNVGADAGSPSLATFPVSSPAPTSMTAPTFDDIILDADRAEYVDPDQRGVENIPDIPSDEGNITVSPFELFELLLQDNEGIFLGDQHGFLEIPNFLKDMMEALRDLGVRVLFIEMLDANDPEDQLMIDHLAETGDVQGFADYLKNEHWDKEDGWAEAIAEMVLAALNAGMDVVGLDGDFDDGVASRNETWADTVEEYTEGPNFHEGDKYIVFGGAGHSASFSFNKGVDWILGKPGVDFRPPEGAEEPEAHYGDGQDNDFEIQLPEHSDTVEV